MLTSQRLREITTVVTAALGIPAARREGFIDEASHGDSSVRELALRVLHEFEARPDLSTDELMVDVVLDRLVHTSVDPAFDEETTASVKVVGVSRFRVERCLGSGGFGTVYEAQDLEQNTRVALKVLRRNDPTFLYRFKREFRALVDIRHPNLVELYELFAEGDGWCFTMELVQGVHFLQYVDYRQRANGSVGSVACDVSRLRAAALQLATGIAALHAAGIVHRDIKPSNVLVSDEGRVRVLDFGLARELERSPSESMLLLGTPAYMSPEQWASLPVGEPADWYSFGLILFQALAGSLPERRMTVADDRLSPSAKVAVDSPADLDELCRALLQRDPSARPSAPEIIDRLGGAALLPTIAVRPPLTFEEPVGREPELATLRRLFELTQQGRVVIVNLHATSGVGKTTLLRTFRRRLTQSDPEVVFLAGRCHESEVVPFKALDDLIDALSHYLEKRSTSEAEALAPRDAEYLTRLFPVLGRVEAIAHRRRKAPAIIDSQELRERAFGSFADLLSRLSDTHPVVLVIDDLQWGDLDSAALIRGLFTGPSPPSLLFVASYRSDEVDSSPFLQSWRSGLAHADSLVVHDLELNGLTPSESRQLAARLISPTGAGDDPRIDSIVEESVGNPFLIEQLATAARGRTGQDERSIRIQDVIVERLDHLQPHVRRFLEVVAVAGRPVAPSLAYAASGSASADYSMLFALVADHLLRVRDARGQREIEIYHDRIRETIIAALEPGEYQHHHLSLARAIEAEGVYDPAVLASHFQQGGETEAAVNYTRVAADHALAALAFNRAVKFFQLAIDQKSWSRDDLVALRRKLARALVDAGDGPGAARVYLEAARDAAASDRIELKRLASEQLLRSGRLEDGLGLLGGIARDLRIWVPATRRQAVLSLLSQRCRVRLRSLEFHTARSSGVSASDRAVLDVYWSLVIGLAMVDPVQSSDFHARHMLLALRSGDRDASAMAMATEATYRAASGRRDARKIQELLATAQRLSAGTTHPEALGLIAVMDALCTLLMGEWRSAWELSERAESVLLEQCTGVAWEQAANTLTAVAAALHLGEWSRLASYARNLPTVLRDARAKGDIHSMCNALGGAHIVFLGSDQPEAVEEFVRDAMSAFRHSCFTLPQFNLAMEAPVDIALYRRDADLAWRLVDSMWSQLVASLLLRVQYVAILAFHLRARAAIAMAASSPSHAKGYLREAAQCARKIERQHVSWGDVLASVTRAGIASFHPDSGMTLDLLAAAETRARRAQMSLYVAGCQYRRGTLLGGPAGEALVAETARWAQTEGVIAPSRVFDTFLPGRF